MAARKAFGVSMAVACLVLIGAPTLTGCSRPPTLPLDDIERVTLGITDGGWTRPATAAEIERLIAAYAEADDLDDSMGTTHPVVAEITLTSGSTLRIWGGTGRFQTVSDGRGQWNIASTQLDQLLRQIAAEAQLGPQATVDAQPRYAAAEAVLRRYWVLVSSGQYKQAQALLGDDHGRLYRDPALADTEHVEFGLTATGHRFASGIKRWKKYADLCEFQVTYDTHAESLSGEPAGHRTRFVVLGKLTPESQWRVLGVFTSP